MSATFIERCIRVGDWENDGGIVDIGQLQTMLTLYEAGQINAQSIKDWFACTTEQGDELDEVLGTMPGTLLTLLQAAARARWANTVCAIFTAGVMMHPDYDTANECRAALGL